MTELDKIKEKVKLESDKLWIIMDSINSERLILEWKEKLQQESDDKILSLEKDIIDLWEQKKQLDDDIDATRKSNEAEKNIIDNENLKLQAILDNIRNNIAIEKKILDELKTDYDNEMGKLNWEYDKRKIEIWNEINESIKKNNTIIKNIEELKKDKEEKEKEISKFNEEILLIRTKKLELDSITESIASGKTEIIELDKETKRKKKEIEQFSKELQTIQNSIDKLNTSRPGIEWEIETLKSERDTLVKEKMLFQDEKAQLEQKELYIKDRYTKAWISYS